MTNYQEFQDGGVPIKAWVNGVELEEEARNQLLNVSRLPIVYKHVAVMPDVHWGIGATVGSVIATKAAIIPAAVGVDIGCGMIAVRTSLTSKDLPDNLKDLRTEIERTVPVGFGKHEIVPASVASTWKNDLAERFKKIIETTPSIEKGSLVDQLATLGGGNHFIEICLDTEDRVWIMLHSGSRGVGNRIGRLYIEKAKNSIQKSDYLTSVQDLAYFKADTKDFDDYCYAMEWAQDFAKYNRELMLDRILKVMHKLLTAFTLDNKAINCHHNYVAKENHFGENVLVTRKGAIRAQVGDLGIIPGSMGAKSYIVRGKGNPESFNSCSHGAGRKLSRTKAKAQFTVEDLQKATEGVECRKDQGVLDESPGAYKDIDKVLEAEKDLVEVLYTIKQVLCIKG